jgi:hypothetical protein
VLPFLDAGADSVHFVGSDFASDDERPFLVPPFVTKICGSLVPRTINGARLAPALEAYLTLITHLFFFAGS